MKYALLIYGNEAEWEARTEDDRTAMYAEYAAVSASPGIYGGGELQAAATATTVRVREGEALTTDGPFAETKEVLGGFFLLEADNLDDAIAIAARIPDARGGSVEVRPIVEHS